MLSLLAMRSKVVWFLVAGVILLCFAGFLILRKNYNSKTVVTPLSILPVDQESVLPKLLIWNDQAGFLFQYPEGLSVNIHLEDNQNYSHLDFTSSGNDGGIFIIASDTKFKDVDAWVKADKNLVDGLVMDTTLDNKPAKKISFADSGKIIVGAIDDQILFQLKTENSDVFWKNIFDQMISSYKFVYPTVAPAVGSPGGSSVSSGDIIEEEEIIQ
jgi:hypothetical protein